MRLLQKWAWFPSNYNVLKVPGDLRIHYRGSAQDDAEPLKRAIRGLGLAIPQLRDHFADLTAQLIRDPTIYN